MPDRGPIEDLDMLHRRPTCPSETNMPDRRAIGDRHAPSETTCLIGDPQKTDMPHQRTTYPIGDQLAPSETDMPAESNWNLNTLYLNIRVNIYLLIYIHVGLRWVVNQACQYPMGHISFRWVSDQACRSLIGLRSGLSVFDQASRSPIVIIFS